jgi:hypothetical protein
VKGFLSMSTVQELVKQKKDKREKEHLEYVKKEDAKYRKGLRKTFNDEVNIFIWEFERRYFKLDSSKEEVADAILDSNENNFVTGECYKVLDFDYDEGDNTINPKKSKKFREWKKALEDKFGLTIIFYVYERKEERYGSSGFATYPNYIYEGICVKFSFKTFERG